MSNTRNFNDKLICVSSCKFYVLETIQSQYFSLSNISVYIQFASKQFSVFPVAILMANIRFASTYIDFIRKHFIFVLIILMRHTMDKQYCTATISLHILVCVLNLSLMVSPILILICKYTKKVKLIYFQYSIQFFKACFTGYCDKHLTYLLVTGIAYGFPCRQLKGKTCSFVPLPG